jgi:hypothetical protein
MKKYSASLAIKEMQLKTTLRFHLPQSEWQSSKNQTNVCLEQGDNGRTLIW